MVIMEDRAIGIIYALKQGKYSADVNIRKFMSEWSDSNWDYFERDAIDDVLRRAVADYLECYGNRNEIARYFYSASLWIKNEYDRMISFLQQIQVRKDENYINGMRDNPYPNFEVFKNE